MNTDSDLVNNHLESLESDGGAILGRYFYFRETQSWATLETLPVETLGQIFVQCLPEYPSPSSSAAPLHNSLPTILSMETRCSCASLSLETPAYQHSKIHKNTSWFSQDGRPMDIQGLFAPSPCLHWRQFFSVWNHQSIPSAILKSISDALHLLPWRWSKGFDMLC